MVFVFFFCSANGAWLSSITESIWGSVHFGQKEKKKRGKKRNIRRENEFFHFLSKRVFFFCYLFSDFNGVLRIPVWQLGVSLFQSKLSFLCVSKQYQLLLKRQDQLTHPDMIFFSQDNPSTSFIISTAALCKLLSLFRPFFDPFFLFSFMGFFFWFI